VKQELKSLVDGVLLGAAIVTAAESLGAACET
jgi:hypothetical protein